MGGGRKKETVTIKVQAKAHKEKVTVKVKVKAKARKDKVTMKVKAKALKEKAKTGSGKCSEGHKAYSRAYHMTFATIMKRPAAAAGVNKKSKSFVEGVKKASRIAGTTARLALTGGAHTMEV